MRQLPFGAGEPMTDGASERAEGVKSCCASLYAGEWARLLLGESWHPGGLGLTERLGLLLELSPADLVLDVASGNGASAVFLARRFGCQVLGVDYSATSAREATARAAEADLAGRARFLAGDAERLPVVAAGFDALICECAFCTFPNKATAAAELVRALRPGGRLGLSDLTRGGTLPDEFQTLLGRATCLGDARPIDEYVAYLQAAGLGEPRVEVHDAALVDLVCDVRAKLLGAELLAKLTNAPLPSSDLAAAKRVAQAAAQAAADGRLGYALIVARRPDAG